MSSSFKSLQQAESSSKNEPLDKLLQRCKGVSFEEFRDILHRPSKNGKLLGVLDYQKRLTKILETEKHLCLCKSVGCGGTEYFLRWLLFRIMTNDEWQHRQCPIVVGPSQSLANRILARIRRTLETHGILFDSAKNYVTINKCELFSVPSHNINSLRSLESPAAILVSESDFMPGEINEIRQVSERYISKSDPYIILESTINSNVGLYASIFREEDCLYHREIVKFTDAPEMYSEKSVLKMRQSRSFGREMLCDFSAVGAVEGTYPPEWVSRAFNNQMDIEPIKYYLAADPGWSPAKTGVTLIGVDSQNRKQVIISDEYDESEDAMVELIVNLYNIYNVKNIFCDLADKRFIKRLKAAINERTDFEEHIKFLKDNKILSQYNPLKSLMIVVPLLFTQNSSKEMLSYSRLVLEQNSITIPTSCTTLQNALYNLKDVDGHALKTELSQGHGGDCWDSWRMVLYGADN